MTRVASFSHHQLLVRHMLHSQREQLSAQLQVSTGKRTGDFKGLAREAPALLGAKELLSRQESFIDSNRQLIHKLELYNASLGSLSDTAESLRQDLIEAVNLNSGIGLMDKVENHFLRAVDVLNTRYQGRYIFAGTKTDTAPVPVDNITDFLALPSVSDAFQNNDHKLSAKVDDNQTSEYGLLADEIAEPLFEAMRRIMEFDSGTLPAGAGAYAPAGPFGDPLDANQRDFIVNEFDRALQAIQAVREQETANGVRLEALDKLHTRQQDDVIFTESLVADIENVDLAEAITKLQQDELALNASMQILSRMNQISLLNFI